MSYRDFLIRLLTITLLGVLLIGAWTLRSILMLGFLAIILAVTLHIPAAWLERRGLTHPLATTISVIGFALLTTLLTIWMLPSMIIELANLVAIVPGAMSELGELYEHYRLETSSLKMLLPPLVDERFGQAQSVLGLGQGDLTSFVVNLFNSALPVLTGVGNTVITFLANLILVLFIAILLLAEPQSYRKVGLMLVPRQHQRRFIEIWDEVEQVLKLWITAQSISVGITVILVWSILGGLLQMENALIVALFAGVATFIPNVGAFLPLIPIVIFTLAHDPGQLLVLAPVYLMIQLVESNVLTPYIVKAELSIPTGGLLFFQVIAVALFGPLGVLLAAPLLAVIATVVREVYSYDLLGLRSEESDVNTNHQHLFRESIHALPLYLLPSLLRLTAGYRHVTCKFFRHLHWRMK